MTLDTDANKVSWKVTYEGLTGDPAAAHFHGPAKVGENAAPVVDISGNLSEGTADVTPEQLQMIREGNTYINIHTAQSSRRRNPRAGAAAGVRVHSHTTSWPGEDPAISHTRHPTKVGVRFGPLQSEAGFRLSPE